MTLNLNRLIAWIIVLTLPLVVLLGWFVTEQAPGWMMTVPGWLRPTGADPALGACEALAAVDGYQGEFVNFQHPTAVTAQDAPARAREQVAAHVDVSLDGADVSQATLVRARFPGAGERLAWLVIVTLPREADTRFDRVAVAFVDADSGDLLALSSGVSVTDARTACGGGPVSRRALVRQYLPLLLAGAYVVLVVGGVLVRRWWLRRRG